MDHCPQSLGEKIKNAQNYLKCWNAQKSGFKALLEKCIFCLLFMHIIVNLLVFFWYSLDQYLPPPTEITILSALVFSPGSKWQHTNLQTTQHGLSEYRKRLEKGSAIGGSNTINRSNQLISTPTDTLNHHQNRSTLFQFHKSRIYLSTGTYRSIQAQRVPWRDNKDSLCWWEAGDKVRTTGLW